LDAAGRSALPPGLQRLARGGVHVHVAPDHGVALGDGVAVAGDHHLRRGGGDLERGAELDSRLRAEVLADGDAGQGVAAAVRGAARVGGSAAVAVVGAGGEADGGGRGEGGGQQRAAADHREAFRIGGPGAEHGTRVRGGRGAFPGCRGVLGGLWPRTQRAARAGRVAPAEAAQAKGGGDSGAPAAEARISSSRASTAGSSVAKGSSTCTGIAPGRVSRSVVQSTTSSTPCSWAAVTTW